MSYLIPMLLIGALSLSMTSCANDKAATPFSPTPVPLAAVPPASFPTVSPVDPYSLVVFREPNGAQTTDLRDAGGRIIQLTTAGEIIFTPDGSRFPGYEITWDARLYWGPPTYFIGRDNHFCDDVFCVFSVRFGSVDGERRAYLTHDYGHDNPGTMIAIEVVSGKLVFTQTSLYPPGTPTLSGTVTEMTSTGAVPVAGALVARSVPAGWQSDVTDSSGRYKISGLIDGTAEIQVIKDGYQKDSRQFDLYGDPTYDVQLVRR